MFTGIIEAVGPTKAVRSGDQCLQLDIERPSHFDDLKIGDSVACDGICLTIESFDTEKMTFTLGYETLQVTGWTSKNLENRSWNLERSLRFGDRVHGHLVSGHVDAMAPVVESYSQGDSWILKAQLPDHLGRYVWKKSSLTLQGVSLTVNSFDGHLAEVCLVPETLKKTNLKMVNVGEQVTIETDYYMKGMLCTQPKN